MSLVQSLELTKNGVFVPWDDDDISSNTYDILSPWTSLYSITLCLRTLKDVFDCNHDYYKRLIRHA
jgi:hypothetical protein